MHVISVAPGQLTGGVNPRTSLDDERLNELTDSVREHGILEPIRVVEIGNDTYRIESGHRRHLAALAAGLDAVPVIVTGNGDTPKGEEFVRAMVTNIQRADLNLVEEAEAYLALITKHGLTPEGVAQKVGVSKRRVTERMELLEFPPAIIDHFRSGALPPSVRTNLRAICRVSSELATMVANRVVEHPLSAQLVSVLATDPGRVVAHTVEDHPKLGIPVGKRAFPAVHLTRVPKKLKSALIQATQSQSWEDTSVRFDDTDADAAKAAGVLYQGRTAADTTVEFICDPTWAIDRLEVVAERLVEQAKERVEAEKRNRANAQKMSVGGTQGPPSADAIEKARNAEQTRLVKEARVMALSFNEDLGAELLRALWVIDVGPLAKEYVELLGYGFLDGRRDSVFLTGIGLCLAQYREVDAKGKVTYLKRGRAEAADEMKTWLELAKDGSELMGRLVVALLASHLSDQNVLPSSAQLPARLPLHAQDGEYMGQEYVAPLAFAKALDKQVKALPLKLRPKEKPSAKHVRVGLEKYDAAQQPAVEDSDSADQ